MPVQQQTTSTSSQQQTGGWQNQYNQVGMSAYNTLIPQMQSMLSGFMTNPLQSSFFQNLLGAQQKQIGQAGQSQMATLANNLSQSGINPNSAFAQSQIAQQGRATSAQQASGFNALLSQIPGLQMQAGQMASSFNPLVTGGTSQATTAGQSQQIGQMTGLGSWLPQVLGGGLGALSNLMGGGSSPFNLGNAGSSLMPAGQGSTINPLSPATLEGGGGGYQTPWTAGLTNF